MTEPNLFGTLNISPTGACKFNNPLSSLELSTSGACTLKNPVGKLEQDLFGQSLDTYYKLKENAKKGDVNSKVKLEKMRDIFIEALKAGDIVNFN